MQKRLGTALRCYKNKRRGAALSDRKGTDEGRLTDPIIDGMQTAYGYAIRNNKCDQASSIAAIWTIYPHMIMGPPEENVGSHHSYCPNDDKTSCKYHKDKIFNTNIYDESKCLPFVFRGEFHGIFTQQSSPDLLNACQRGLTQNQNESINNMICSKCPKRVLCRKSRFVISVCESNEMREESNFWNH